MNLAKRSFVIAVLLGGLFWLLDSVIDYYYFYDLRFFDILILRVPPVEIYMRAVGVVCIGACAIILMIFANKKDMAERMYRHEQERARSLIDIIGIAIVTADSSGKVASINRAGQALFGRADDDLIGRVFYDIMVPSEYRGDLKDLFEQIIGGNRVIPKPYEMEIVTGDGRRRIVEWNGTLLYDAGGNISGIVASGEDITDRLQSSADLKESQRRLEMLFSNLPGVAYRCRNDSEWSMEFISGSCLELTGFNASDLVDNAVRSYGDLIVPEDRDYVWNSVQSAVAKKLPFQIEYRITTSNGSEKWVWEQGRGVWDMTDRVLALEGIIHDITDRKLIQAKLEESELRYRNIVESSPIPIIVHSRGKISFINSAAVTTLGGRDAEQFIGQSIVDIVSFGSDESRRKRILEVGDAPERNRFIEGEMLRMDGRRIFAEMSVSHIDYMGAPAIQFVFRDISEQKNARDAIRASEAKFRAMFESAQDAIYLKDTNDRYVEINSAFETMFACRAGNVIGWTDEDLFGDRLWGGAYQSDARVLKGEIINEERYLKNEVGKKIFHVVKVPLRNGSNDIIGVCGIARDISEMKRLQELSGRAQRLETAGRIAGQVAHDFNNLLGPLMAYPELIKEELPPEHPILQYIEDIEKSASQIAEINMQLLTLGRRGHYNLEVVNLNEIIGQVIAQPGLLRDTIRLHVDFKDELLNIKGGISQLTRMITNLVKNAADAIHEAGDIYISTDNFYADHLQESFENLPRGEYVKMVIKDTGIGIHPDIIDSIYDPFFTTKSAARTKGSGLGLSVVHSVVKDHNGYIFLDSRVGEGSAFSIYIPATREATEPAPAFPPFPKGDEKILVIDDDSIQRDVTVRLLEKLGYNAWTIESGEKALELMKHNSFDLLILDMIMPLGMDGLETYKRVLTLNPRQKAIIISGFAETEKVSYMQELGAGMFIRKPLKLQMLAQAVREELDRKVVQ